MIVSVERKRLNMTHSWKPVPFSLDGMVFDELGHKSFGVVPFPATQVAGWWLFTASQEILRNSLGFVFLITSGFL